MRKLALTFLFLFTVSFVFLRPAYAPIWGAPGIQLEEEDGDPKGRARRVKVTNGTLTQNSDGSWSLSITGGAEVNNLETICTDIETTEFFVGDTTDGGNYVSMSSGATMNNTGAVTIADLFLKLGGDVATAGTYDFGAANVVLEIPNAAAPTTDATGEIAIDTDLITQGMLQVYLASAIANIVATTDTPADNEVPTYDAGGGTVQWEAGGGGGGATYREYTFLPHTAGFDATNPAVVDWITSSGTGTVRFPRAKFDDGDDDVQHYSFTMPSDATASADWILDIYSYSDEDVDENVLWAVQVSATSDNDADNCEEQAADSADYQAENYDKSEAKALCKVSLTIDYANCDGAVAGDEVNFIFYRDGDGTGGTDDHTNEVYLTRLHLKIPRS